MDKTETTTLQSTQIRRRVPFVEKLATLKIAEDDFAFFDNHFVGRKWPYFYNRFPNGWRKGLGRTGQPIFLDRNVIGKHLLHEFAVGVLAGPRTRRMAIDLDNHKEGPLIERYTSVTNALRPALPIVFRSSDSGGLHLYYFFKKTIRTSKAITLFANLLSKANIQIRPGHVELGPTEAKCLRLPLGPGSILLDHLTLKPLGNTCADALGWLRDELPQRAIDIADLFPDPLLCMEQLSPKLPQHVQGSYKRAMPQHEALDEQARLILLRPITEYGTRHHLTLSLIRFFWAQGYPAGITEAKIAAWYRQFMGLHTSRTLENAPEEAFQELSRMVKSFYHGSQLRRRGCGSRELIACKISLSLCKQLCDRVITAAAGAKLNRECLRNLQWGFSLIQLFHMHQKDVQGIPTNLMKQFNGASTRSYGIRRDFWLKQGLFELHSGHDKEAHQSCQYRYRWELSKVQEVSICEGALRNLFTKSQILGMFTPTVARSILDNADSTL